MREINRINRILGLVEKIWKIDPDYRFIQLIEMIEGRYSRDHKNEGRFEHYLKEDNRENTYIGVDLFHLEDDDLECYLYELLEDLESNLNSIDIIFARLLKFFPYLQQAYEDSIDRFGRRLDTVIIEDIFMPEILLLISENQQRKKLESIFEFIEVSMKSDNDNVKNLLIVTVLEILGNDKTILETAQKYMGPETMKHQLEADKGLGRC